MADLSQPNNPFITNPDDHLARLLAPKWMSLGISLSFKRQGDHQPAQTAAAGGDFPASCGEGHLGSVRPPEEIFHDVDGLPGCVRGPAGHGVVFEGGAGQGEGVRTSDLRRSIWRLPRWRRPRSRRWAAVVAAAIVLRCRPARARLPKPALRQFTPPMAGGQQPESQADDGAHASSLLRTSSCPNVNMAHYGDPLGQDRSAFQRPRFGRRYR